MPTSTSDRVLSQSIVDALIRAGLIALLAVFCYMIFHPFLDLMLWALILAVTLYPLHLRLKRRLGDKDGRSSTLLVLIAILILLVPIYLLSVSIAGSVEKALVLARGGGFHVNPPEDSVADWPIIGKAVHGLWLQASTDLSVLTQKYTPQLKMVSYALLGKLAGFGIGLLLFIVALILAGIFMAFGENGSKSAVEIASRLVGPVKGAKIVALCTATIRAVAQGVIGIAFIQMVLVGIGFVLLGIPAAGLLAIAVLLLGIVQAPVALLTIPVLVYVFFAGDLTITKILLMIYLFVAGLADNVLKPLLLGRGVDVPMPVVLIGALGGMVTKGIIGLFLGPVILAVGYELFWQWVREPTQDSKVGKTA